MYTEKRDNACSKMQTHYHK